MRTAGRSAEGCCERFFADDLGETEVGELQVEVLVDEEDVFWLDVPVDDTPFVLCGYV